MRAYLDLLNDIIENGHLHEDRTGVGRISIFGRMIRFNLKEGFPLVTSRKIFTKALIEEMLWFIKGDTNVNNLNANGVKIWDNWTLRKEHVDGIREKISNTEANYWLLASMEGMAEKAVDTIGPMYGYVWRHSLSGVDQLDQLIKNLKEKPYSSRHVVTAWVPELIPDENMSPQENIMMGRGALAPCHMMFQCFVKQPKDGGKPELSVLMYQRSVDAPIGAPYNIAQYSLLTHMLAQVCDYDVGEFIWSTGDTHIYANQLDLVKKQIQREPLKLSTLYLNPHIKDINMFKSTDIVIQDYVCDDSINYPIAV